MSNLNHLVGVLSDLYHLKVRSAGTKFLGLTVDYNRAARTIAISYSNFIKPLLTRVHSESVKHAKTPAMYTPPILRLQRFPARHATATTYTSLYH